MTARAIAAQAPPPELLLGRSERAGDLASSAAAWVEGRRVLVTGAAGSVGTPLSHLLHRAGPASLVLVDHHEHSLFTLERSVGPVRGERLSYALLDVRDRRGLERLFRRYRPEVVMHLAAAKHVPFGERFPEGVLDANVLATRALLDLAAAHGVERLVYPSSDKSVAPPSLYGATKRLCEAMVQLDAREAGRHWTLVRYVNIVGTRGSVIETFTGLLAADQPLSVTDERMTRYWISMDEALWLLVEGGRHARPGELMMAACGDPVPVVETARRLADWYRPERSPYPIELVGMRPGERLHEVLLSSNERVEPGPSVGLLRVRSRRESPRLAEVTAAVDELRHLVDAGDGDAIRRVAMRAAERLQ